MSRSSIGRLLEEADLTPPRSVSWRNSHAPDCEATAHDLCSFYLNALRCVAQGHSVIGSDEKTGRQIRQRQYPTQPMAPGKPEKREPEDSRHGVRALRASCSVATGHVVWHLAQGVHQLPEMQRDDGVVDNLQIHWRLDVCRLVAQWCNVPWGAQELHRGGQRRAFLRQPPHKQVCHFTPKHGAWLNQVEVWLSVLAQRFLQRGAFDSAHDFATRLSAYREVYNTHHAPPSRWTYTGQPLGRATPFRGYPEIELGKTPNFLDS
jgi:hypothetical protein